MMNTETRRMVMTATAACEEKKAEDIRVLELDPDDSAFTDCFLICHGSNPRQNQAIANEIELRLKRQFDADPNSMEGFRQADWILMDYVDFVVHIFSEEKRGFYDIERLRKSATRLSLEELKASLAKKVATVRKKQAGKKAIAKKTVAKKKATPPAVKKATKKAIKPAGKRKMPL
jgi:ribosome-associated protein